MGDGMNKKDLYIKVSDIKYVCDPYKDHDVKQYTAEEIANTIIVRCKDCIHREKTPLSVCISVESAKHSFFCELTDRVVTEQFYCGDGEREMK